MEIKVRRIATYKDVEIEHGDVLIHLGLFDEKDCTELIEKLQSAIDDLSS